MGGAITRIVIGRLASIFIVAGGWLFAGVRTVLDLIGYSTVPEDIDIARTRLDEFFGFVLSVPWWAIVGFALLSTLWLIWVSWPRTKLDARIVEMEKLFDKYIKPREITEEQREIIIKFLLDRKPPETVHILHHSPDDEALHYAAQIQHALIKSDWKTALHAAVPQNIPTDRSITKTGVRFLVEYTPSHRENSRALRLLEDALRAANVSTNGMGSWTNPDGMEMKLYLVVGPRPRI